LLETIEDNFGEEIAGEMERRLINSIKGRNASKFARGAKKIKESQKSKV